MLKIRRLSQAETLCFVKPYLVVRETDCTWTKTGIKEKIQIESCMMQLNSFLQRSRQYSSRHIYSPLWAGKSTLKSFVSVSPFFHSYKNKESLSYHENIIGFIRHESCINPLNPELNPICYLLALLAHHFLHVNRIRVKSLTIRLLMSYIYIWSAYSWCF